MCMALVQNTTSLYIVRFLLERRAGFFRRGALSYGADPSRYRARIASLWWPFRWLTLLTTAFRFDPDAGWLVGPAGCYS